MSKNTKLRWGLMAPGGIAHVVAEDFALAGIQFAAVGSRSLERAAEFATRHGVARQHGSYEALAQDPEIDVIYIASPHSEHFANARLALQGGKHILVEKPFMINAAQAREIADLARERGLFAMEAMWTRFLPHMLRIRELLSEGALGEIVAVEASHNQNLPAERHPRLHDLKLGGGALLDLGVYPVAFSFDILGAPETILATGRLGATGADETVAMALGYESGAVAALHTTMVAKAATSASITGTLGSIEIAPAFYTQTDFKRFDGDYQLVEHFTERVPGRGMQQQAIELERCVALGLTESPLMTLSESVAIAETMDTIRGQLGLRYPGE
jgi:predicted dehydrogenase